MHGNSNIKLEQMYLVRSAPRGWGCKIYPIREVRACCSAYFIGNIAKLLCCHTEKKPSINNFLLGFFLSHTSDIPSLLNLITLKVNKSKVIFCISEKRIVSISNDIVLLFPRSARIPCTLLLRIKYV